MLLKVLIYVASLITTASVYYFKATMNTKTPEEQAAERYPCPSDHVIDKLTPDLAYQAGRDIGNRQQAYATCLIERAIPAEQKLEELISKTTATEKQESLLIDPSIIAQQRDRIWKRMKEVMAQRNEILEAFVAKYGYQPDEVEQVLQMRRDGTQVFSIQKKSIQNQDTDPSRL